MNSATTPSARDEELFSYGVNDEKEINDFVNTFICHFIFYIVICISIFLHIFLDLGLGVFLKNSIFKLSEIVRNLFVEKNPAFA